MYKRQKYSGLIRFVEVHMVSTLKLPVGIDSFEKDVYKRQIFPHMGMVHIRKTPL